MQKSAPGHSAMQRGAGLPGTEVDSSKNPNRAYELCKVRIYMPHEAAIRGYIQLAIYIVYTESIIGEQRGIERRKKVSSIAQTRKGKGVGDRGGGEIRPGKGCWGRGEEGVGRREENGGRGC